MSETLKHRIDLKEKLEAVFGAFAVTPDKARSTKRTVLPMLGGAGPDEYDFSPSEYLLRRWRKGVEARRMPPAFRRILEEIQSRYL